MKPFTPYEIAMDLKLIILYISFRKQQATRRTGGAL